MVPFADYKLVCRLLPFASVGLLKLSVVWCCRSVGSSTADASSRQQ